jgi:3-deoxy-manno-octulosonate cytidylyltransferase (CMP-KDO synthetase)
LHNAIIVIPARYESSRLPGKPLVELLGISMLRRTYNRCLQAFPRERIYVATDDQRIFDHCQEANISVLMTSPDCMTGTDRIAEVAEVVEADTYINVQGDEPIMNPDDIKKILDVAKRNPKDVVNGMCAIDSEELFYSPTIPKVVARPDGRLLYMSRAAIPTNKQHEFASARRQVCIYAFPKAALVEYSSVQTKTPLELIEDIEILRFLELGYDVHMVELTADTISVDVPEDIPRAEEAIRSRGLIDAG